MENNEKNKGEINNNSEPKIVSNNPVFNEIQEILTDQEMIQKKLIENNNKDNYYLELNFPGGLILKSFDVKFLLIIPTNYPKQEPELFCLTAFTHPHISDGRNLINDVINSEWTFENTPLDFIINKIPKFVIKFSNYTDKSLIIGKYQLKHIYPINLLNNLPIFFHLIPEINKIITIGDISLCLYELNNNNKDFKYCILSFFVNIKDITEILVRQKKNLIIIKYKLEKSVKKININSQNYNLINDILKEKMKLYQKKKGKLPDIDIKYLEKEIEEKEKELLNKENNKTIFMYKEKCLRLMDLYQQAIEYYSAVNDPKFLKINIKIHQLTLNLEENEKQKNINEKIEDKNKNEIKKEDEKRLGKDEVNKVENKKEQEIKKKEEVKEENKNKEENNSLRLKINEGELNTLDVGEDEEEEEDENK